MKRAIFFISLVMSVQYAYTVRAESASLEKWTAFLQRPTAHNLDDLISQISVFVEKCDWGRSEYEDAVPSKIRYALFNKIASGNEASLRVGFYTAQCFGGGARVDFGRSAGQFFDKKPKEFLQEVKRSSVSMEMYVEIMVLFPESLIDDVSGQINAVVRRIRILEQNKIDHELYNAGMYALKKEERELKSIRNSQ